VLSEENELEDLRSFEYDQVNNLVKLTDRNERVRTFSYDALYRRTAEVWLDALEDPIRTIAFAYNDAGELTHAEDPDSEYTFTYDHLGRVTLVDNDGTAGVPRVRLANEFDANGNRTQLDATIGASTADLRNSYLYDNLSRMTQVTQTANGGNSVAEKRVDFAYKP
jgi:YD repeat-containing protein